jgi:ferredoxin-NADP reductase/CRP-like cAMP-binding protein
LINSNLLKTGLFSKLSSSELDQIVATTQEVTIPDGEVFIQKDDVADALYVIESGVCQVFTTGETGHEIILARLESGAYLGEQALLNETPGRRNASVRAISEMKLLKVSHASFRAILTRDEPLRKMLAQVGREQLQSHAVIEKLDRSYLSRKRGEIQQYDGKFLDSPAIITNFVLKDGREIFSAKVVDKNIHALRDANAKTSQEAIYNDKDLHRELMLENNILVGVTSFGEWAALPQIINMIFDQVPLDEIQLNHFRTHGELVIVIPEAPAPTDDTEIICNCMYISLGEIKAKILSGAIDIKTIQDTLGASTICGTCGPRIQTVLGHGSWQAIRIKKTLPLTAGIHAYQIVPALGEVLSPYKAGQYIVMQCFMEGNWIERSYTLTSTPTDQHYEIAVKREEGGLLSNWLFEHESEAPLLRVSAPDGKFTPDLNAKSPMVCLMAGIGITPGVAFTRAAVEQRSPRSIYISYSAHANEDFAYLPVLKELAELNPAITVVTRTTKDEGHLDENSLAELIKNFQDAEYFICGPAAYETTMRSYLTKLGIPAEKIFIEKFTHSYDPA